jgi:hypothetical protein
MRLAVARYEMAIACVFAAANAVLWNRLDVPDLAWVSWFVGGLSFVAFVTMSSDAEDP